MKTHKLDPLFQSVWNLRRFLLENGLSPDFSITIHVPDTEAQFRIMHAIERGATENWSTGTMARNIDGTASLPPFVFQVMGVKIDVDNPEQFSVF